MDFDLIQKQLVFCLSFDIYIYLHIFISFALELRPLNDFESPNPRGKKDEKMEKVAPTILQVRKNISVSHISHRFSL